MTSTGKTGVLLLNLGTPDAPTTPAVRRYLREFLSDPKVLDINPLGRWVLLRAVILPFRSPKSAAAYSEVWMDEGSPLLVHSEALTSKVAKALDTTPVQLAMRYGQPSIAAALDRLHESGATRLVVVPLYPQFADSSTGTGIEAVRQELEGRWKDADVAFVPAFYDHPKFIDAWSEVARPALDAFAPDHVLFSFHGLPERHVLAASDPRVCLASDSCCNAIVAGNANCYRAQCFATWRAMVPALDLDRDATSVSFQSRLGRDPWIKPYTDFVLDELAERGVKRLAVLCPAFVADCLETLEEIGIRARDQFVAAGGEALQLVPSLNAAPAWVDAVVTLTGEARREAGFPAS